MWRLIGCTGRLTVFLRQYFSEQSLMGGGCGGDKWIGDSSVDASCD